jgi:anhydro-N-acetylmuramic acid kinase
MSMIEKEKFLALGLMSGTSMDAIDVALLETDGESHIKAIDFASYPISDTTRALLSAAMELAAKNEIWPDMAGKFASSRSLDWAASASDAITKEHIHAIEAFKMRPNTPSPDIIGFHGQTIWHDPAQGRTVQIGDGQSLADHFATPVVDQFRLADMQAGGQGAPLVPLFHAALAAEMELPLAILNIGGVSNVTYIGRNRDLLAFDVGPGNALINDWVSLKTGKTYDKDGILAAQGRIEQMRLRKWLEQDFFKVAPPKSLDRHGFDVLQDMQGLSVEDGAASLTALTVASIVKSLDFFDEAPVQWLVCGGGRHNKTMMRQLDHGVRRNGAALQQGAQPPTPRDLALPCDAVGWQGDALEAQAFAWLAVRSVKGLPLSLPETTGVSRPMPGGVFRQPIKA